MTVTDTHKSPNAFVRAARKIYNPIGFGKGYNFVLFFIFGGALMGFTLSQLPKLNFAGRCASLDCIYYTPGSVDKIGIQLHLASILPAAFLACFQFVPVIRHKVILLHRLNGYIILLLSLLSTTGALMLARNALGGQVEMHLLIVLISTAFVVSLAIAYYNVKRLQIEQHRAWMLRAWFYASSIIALRIVMYFAGLIISGQGFLVAITCQHVSYFLRSQEDTLRKFPECSPYFTGQDVEKAVAVVASMTDGSLENVAAAVRLTFGPAMWLCFVLHAIGVEIYLRLTPAETERLRNVSYQRQIEAGMRDPGRAGLTTDRLGDAPRWAPKVESGDGDSTRN